MKKLKLHLQNLKNEGSLITLFDALEEVGEKFGSKYTRGQVTETFESLT